MEFEWNFVSCSWADQQCLIFLF